jgi:hypothetical protein
MASDIVLKDNNEVHVNGWRLVLNGPDLVIDAGQVRRTNNSDFRRAIVHGPNDTLIINYSNDYPNGVIVQSGMTVNGKLHVNSLESTDEINSQSGVTAHGDIKARAVEVTKAVKGTTLEASQAITVGEKTAIKSTNIGLQLGEDDGRAIDVRGKGLQIRGGMHVMEQAYFTLPIRVSDITIAPPPSSQGGDPPYSLLDRIRELERRIQVLENA